MKKTTIFPLIVIVLLLVSCTPQVTVTSAPTECCEKVTVTSTPPPTLTSTPIAVNGIAEDAEGNKLAYLDGEWVVLPAFDDAQSDEIDRVVVLNQGKENQRIVALGADDAELYELSAKGDEWIKLEKVYESCADLELIEQVVYPQFTEATGYTPEEALQYYLENKVFSQGVGFEKESGLYRDDMLYLGSAIVSLEHLPGAQSGDRVLCAYGLFDDFSGEAAAGYDKATPFSVAAVYKGKFMPLVMIGDGQISSYSQNSMNALEDFMAINMPIGARVHVEIQTLSGIKDLTQLDPDTQINYRDNWHRFLDLLDNGYFERMSSIPELSRKKMLSTLDPALRDPGLLARGLLITDKEPLPKK